MNFIVESFLNVVYVLCKVFLIRRILFIMFLRKKFLFVCFVLLSKSIYGVLPTALLLAAHNSIICSQVCAGATVATKVGVPLYFAVRYSSSMHHGIEKIKSTAAGKKSVELAKQSQQAIENYWQQLRKYMHNPSTFDATSNVSERVVEQPFMQATKIDAEQSSNASGFLNFPKNTTHSQTTINHNYAPETWASHFFQWLKEGKQTRSAAVGFSLGAISGYGAHAFFVRPQEKIVVVQVPTADRH
jgi:hypothetical protein